MKRAFTLIALLLCLCDQSWAATYYVSPIGSNYNPCSSEQPCKGADTVVTKYGGGHTILFKPGDYQIISIQLAGSGTPTQPTTLKSETKWAARVMGSTSHGIKSSDGTAWIIVDGFEVTGAAIDGVKAGGTGWTIRNCWIHDNHGQGIQSHYNQITIESNLVEGNGTRLGLDHGCYVDGDCVTVRNNVFRYNLFGYGMQLWSGCSNLKAYNNLVYGNYGGCVIGSSGTGNNIFANNTIDKELRIYTPHIEKVWNNIILSPTGYNPMNGGSGDYSQVTFDYNLYPACITLKSFPGMIYGTHNLCADPMIADKSSGKYWLLPGSPGIEAGCADFVPDSNFWGLTNQQTGKPTLGAFPFWGALAAAVIPQSGRDYWAVVTVAH